MVTCIYFSKKEGKKGSFYFKTCLVYIDLWFFFIANRGIVSSIRYSDCWSDWSFLTNSVLYWIKPRCNCGPNPLRCSRHGIALFARKEHVISHRGGTYGEERKVLNYNVAMPDFFSTSLIVNILSILVRASLCIMKRLWRFEWRLSSKMHKTLSACEVSMVFFPFSISVKILVSVDTKRRSFCLCDGICWNSYSLQ